MEKMTSKMWRLYSLIKDRSEKGQYVTIKDICMLLPKDYEYDDRVNTHCENTQVYKDINLINKSNEVEKIILTDKNKIHLAINKTECEQYIKRMENHLWNEYTKYLDIKRKMGIEGQLKLIDLKGNVIVEDSKARREVEPYCSKKETICKGAFYIYDEKLGKVKMPYEDKYELEHLKEMFGVDDEYIEKNKVVE